MSLGIEIKRSKLSPETQIAALFVGCTDSRIEGFLVVRVWQRGLAAAAAAAAAAPAAARAAAVVEGLRFRVCMCSKPRSLIKYKQRDEDNKRKYSELHADRHTAEPTELSIIKPFSFIALKS